MVLKKFKNTIQNYLGKKEIRITAEIIKDKIFEMGNSIINHPIETITTLTTIFVPTAYAIAQDAAVEFSKPQFVAEQTMNTKSLDGLIQFSKLGITKVDTIDSQTYPLLGLKKGKYGIDTKAQYLLNFDGDSLHVLKLPNGKIEEIIHVEGQEYFILEESILGHLGGIQEQKILNLETKEISDEIYTEIGDDLKPILSNSANDQYFFTEKYFGGDPYNFYSIYKSNGKTAFTTSGNEIKILGNNQIAISYTTINSDGFMIEDITTIDLNTGDTEEKREYGYCYDKDKQESIEKYNAFEKYQKK